MKASQLKPYGNWVLIRVDDRQVQIGLIHLPGEQTGIEAIGNRTGHVVSLGPGRRESRKLPNMDMEVNLTGVPRKVLKPGDRVIFRDYLRDANPVDVDDDGEFALMHFADLQCVCDEDVEIGEWSEITSRSQAESEPGWGELSAQS